jgi:hypothetical protein
MMAHMTVSEWMLLALQLWGAASVIATALGRATAAAWPGFSQKALALGVDLGKWRGEVEPIARAVIPEPPPVVDESGPAP